MFLSFLSSTIALQQLPKRHGDPGADFPLNCLSLGRILISMNAKSKCLLVVVSCCIVVLYLSLTVVDNLAQGDGTVDFNRDIRPVLSDKCFHCHGPHKEGRAARLRLDIPEGEQGALIPRKDYHIIKPGDLEGSELWRRITAADEYDRMPPKTSNKKPLTEQEIALFKQWIIQGGVYQDFWAFIPPKKHKAGRVKDKSWKENFIDHFVMASLTKQELEPKEEADKRTLIRRVSFDLTGLPPSLKEIDHFLKDDSPNAYTKLVDRLLNQETYGEHMTRFWADLVRLSDTNGMHKDFHREFSAYRDWLIRSFNRNMPYDEFIKYQLAGDLYEEPTRDQLIASGFNRLHMIIDVGTALPEESLHKNVVDRVTAFGSTFMGMTVQCAQCHDHKYDPFTMKNFYQLYAFFNNFSGKPETVNTPPRGLQPPFINLSTPAQDRKLAAFDAELKQLEQQLETLENKKELQEEIEGLRKKKGAFLATIPGAMHMDEMDPPRETTMLIRGAYDAPGEKVERNTPAFLPSLKKKDGMYTRMDLAEWLVDPGHPLTARVAVNRIWQQFFGVGIVKTSENFGAQGEWPSHLELLDELALSFVESDWNVKKLIRNIVLSKTYRQSSAAEPSDYLRDPENRQLARGSRYRMDAEMIRDQVLAVSGQLNSEMYGRSVKPPQPDGLWKMVAMGGSIQKYVPDQGDKIHRRSLYTYWKRAMPPPQMTIMNAPSREYCTTRRERTNTPLQALLLMNEPEYFKAAKKCANLTLKETDELQERLSHIYEKLTSQEPNAEHLKLMEEALNGFTDIYQNDKTLTEELTPELKDADFSERVNVAAWTMLVHSLFNLEISKVRR
jgi:hypothetical protein